MLERSIAVKTLYAEAPLLEPYRRRKNNKRAPFNGGPPIDLLKFQWAWWATKEASKHFFNCLKAAPESASEKSAAAASRSEPGIVLPTAREGEKDDQFLIRATENFQKGGKKSPYNTIAAEKAVKRHENIF